MNKRGAAAALLALALVVVLAACDNPTARADAAISAANGHLTAAATSESKAKDLTAQLSAVPYTPAGGQQALQIITQLQSELSTQRAELVSAQSALGSAVKLSIKPELKQYIGLEAAAIDTRIKIVDAGLQLYDQTGRMYRAIRGGKATNVAMNKLTTAMDGSMNQISTLTAQATSQTQAASAYFTAHKLGGQ